MDEQLTTALLYLGNGRLPEAESLLRNILSLHPDRLEALEALANLRYRLGDMSGATEAFGRFGCLCAASTAPRLARR